MHYAADLAHTLSDLVELLGSERLRTVAQCTGRVVMYLDDKTVGTRCTGRASHRTHKTRDACSVAWVNDDGKVCESLEHWNGRKVEHVTGVAVITADTTLTEDYLLVTLGHDILGTHKKLLKGRRHTALEQDGLVATAKLLEEFEVLHVTRTYLDDVHISKEIKILALLRLSKSH